MVVLAGPLSAGLGPTSSTAPGTPVAVSATVKAWEKSTGRSILSRQYVFVSVDAMLMVTRSLPSLTDEYQGQASDAGSRT